MANETTRRDMKNIDKTILDNFYKLVHSQPNIRIVAAGSTFKILRALEKAKVDVFNQNLNYCIDRLVTGLESPRALARHGYGTLLLEILKSYQVSTERLFTIAHRKFGHISKETTRDGLLGYFILISIVMESGNYTRSKANTIYLETVYKYISQLLTIKSYLEYPVCNLLMKYYEEFHSYMLADINPQAFGSDSRVPASELLLTVLCNKKEPIRELVNLDNAGLMNLCSTLLDSKLQKRPLHPVFLEVCQSIIKHFPSQFAQFYTQILFPIFFKKNHNDLASMGLELTAELIKHARDSDIEILLNDHIIRILINPTRRSDCIKFYDSVRALFQESDKNSEKKLTAILARFTLSVHRHYTFILDLLNRSTVDVLKKYMKLIMNNFHGFSNRDQTSAVRLIAHIVCRPQMSDESEPTLRAAKFLLLNFVIEQIPRDTTAAFWSINKIPPPKKLLNEDALVATRNAYHVSLDHIVSVFGKQRGVQFFQSLLEFVGHMLDACEIKERTTTIEMWNQFMVFYGQHDRLRMELGEMGSQSLDPITYLFFFYGLQIIEHQFDCKDELKALKQCAEVMTAGGDDSWVDILTDQLVAILSATECNPWMRKLCEVVFGMLLPHISMTSINLICEALNTPLTGDDESDDDESDDVEFSENDDGEDSVGEDRDGDDDDGEDNDGEDNDNESENAGEVEEEFLDDEQMIKLDPVISTMFKLNKKSEVGLFQLRCLDLVKKILTKKGTNSDYVTKILDTIIPLYFKMMKNSKTIIITKKIMNIVKKIPGGSRYPQIKPFLKNKVRTQ